MKRDDIFKEISKYKGKIKKIRSETEAEHKSVQKARFGGEIERKYRVSKYVHKRI